MQITTATGRTVEILADTRAYVTYRNVRDGEAYGPSRLAKPDAKFGSIGREILEALSAHKAAEAKVESDVIVDVDMVPAEQLTAQVAPARTVLTIEEECIGRGCTAPRVGANLCQTHMDTLNDVAPLNGAQVAQLMIQLIDDWTDARVAGQDDLRNDRVGTVLARSFRVSVDGRPYALVSWDEDPDRDLRRRYGSSFIEDLRRL